MKTNTMNKAKAAMKSIITALTLSIAALTLTGTAVAKDPHSEKLTQPFVLQSHVEVKIEPAFTDDWQLDYTKEWKWTSVIEGYSKLLGHFTGEAWGTVQITENGPNIFSEEGYYMGENGDELWTIFENLGGGRHSGILTIDGGTGLFENVTGVAVQHQRNVVEYFDGVEGVLVLNYDDVIVGKINY